MLIWYSSHFIYLCSAITKKRNARSSTTTDELSSLETDAVKSIGTN